LEDAFGGPAFITSAQLVDAPPSGLERPTYSPGYGNTTGPIATRIHKYCDVAGYVAPQNTAYAQTLESLRREFVSPPKETRPIVRWWWPGGDVTADEVRREVRVLDEAGFGGAEFQALRIGLKSDMPLVVAARVNDYPTSLFYRYVRAAAEEARGRGLFLDLTLGSGWPFGGGDAITPELASIELRSIRKTISDASHFRERIQLPLPRPTAGMVLAQSTGSASGELPPGWKERLQTRTRVIAVVAISGTEPVVETREGRLSPEPQPMVKTSGRLDPGSVRVLTSRIQPDGTLDWKVPRGRWHLFIFFQQPVETRVIGGVGSGPQLVLDHMNRLALQAHLGRILGPAGPEIGSFYGKTVRAGFCHSEPSYSNNNFAGRCWRR